MTDTTVTTAAPAATPAATAGINAFFAKLEANFQWLEEDVVAVCQNIEAGIEVAADDLTAGLTWLGTHIGGFVTTLNAVTNSVNGLNAAGIPIPPGLENGLAEVNSAMQGVDDALNDTAVAANPSTALTAGYQAAKALQVAASSALAIAASVKGATAPTAAAAAPAAAS
jgi:hypothetical protein